MRRYEKIEFKLYSAQDIAKAASKPKRSSTTDLYFYLDKQIKEKYISKVRKVIPPTLVKLHFELYEDSKSVFDNCLDCFASLKNLQVIEFVGCFPLSNPVKFFSRSSTEDTLRELEFEFVGDFTMKIVNLFAKAIEASNLEKVHLKVATEKGDSLVLLRLAETIMSFKKNPPSEVLVPKYKSLLECMMILPGLYQIGWGATKKIGSYEYSGGFILNWSLKDKYTRTPEIKLALSQQIRRPENQALSCSIPEDIESNMFWNYIKKIRPDFVQVIYQPFES